MILACSVGLIIYLLQRNKQCRKRAENLEQQAAQLKQELHKARAWEAMIPELRKIAKLDHDVNTPLCVITMSMGRAQKIAMQQNDDVLLGNVQDILSAVKRVGEIMQAVRVLKTNPLISSKDKKPAAAAGGE
ncbi:MAG: hypothetical protein M0R69_04200 [Candidatus Cloacimonetes bacterium]|nr:hypothetical protein [Candidatus Cloacimonadota bacterium]